MYDGAFFLVLEISNDFSKRNKIVDASIGNSKKKQHNKFSIQYPNVAPCKNALQVLDVSSLHNPCDPRYVQFLLQ